MKKLAQVLSLFALSLFLFACSQEATFSYDTTFKGVVKEEGAVVLNSSPMDIHFTEEGVTFTGLLTLATPSDAPEDVGAILPVEADVSYDYNVERDSDSLILHVQVPDGEVSYPLEIKGAQVLLDDANKLTYTSTYSFE